MVEIKVALEIMKNGAFDYIIKNDIALFETQTSIKNAIESIAAMVCIVTILVAAILTEKLFPPF